MGGNRCDNCRSLDVCPVCGNSITGFRHVGVRTCSSLKSSIWHLTESCNHYVEVGTDKYENSGTLAKLVKYNGGPVWKDGFAWVNVFWGSYWNNQQWVALINKATRDIETNQSYSGELKQYGVGTGVLKEHAIIDQEPPGTISNTEIGQAIVNWIKDGTLPDLGEKGAYNIFLPPGVTATLGGQKSCTVFCDYHDTASGNSGPFFTCEPYPCPSGCNQCDNSPFDTLTQGLSEEMVELKTDMNPGTGWVIGNEEICDYCDKTFVCNQLSSGEYVNAWYSDSTGACWHP